MIINVKSKLPAVVLTIVFLFLTLLLFGSCAHNTTNKQVREIKNTFVKMDVAIVLIKCIDGQCLSLRGGSVASGAGVMYGGAPHILTADHVCDYSDVTGPALEKGFTPKITISAIDASGAKHELEVIKQNRTADLCLLKGKNKKLNIPTISLSQIPPEKDNKYYNYAAPAGVFSPGVVPLYNGNYAGIYYGIYAMYTIPVYPGSSGSPIVNSNGELVGMVHSVHRNFHHVSFSATYEQLQIFLSTTAKDDELFILE